MTTPNQPAAGGLPADAASGTSGTGLASWAAQTQEQRKQATQDGVVNSTSKVGIFSGGLVQALQGFVTGVGGFLDQIAHFFDGQWTKLDNHGTAIQDLQDQTQVLEGVVGYGQWTDMVITEYASGVTKTQNAGTQVGPIVGCTLISPGVVQLNSKGLWDITGRFWFGVYTGIYSANYVNYMVEVSNDNFATIFSSALAQVIPDHGTGTINSGTISTLVRVVIPAPGYRVRWRVLMVPNHKIGGGVNFNEIGVLKISDELGPGMRLRSAYTIAGTDWVKLGMMIATGGGTVVDDGFVAALSMNTGRADAVLTGDINFDTQIRANGTVTAQSLGKSAHALMSMGSVTSGDRFELWVRGNGANITGVNGTWLTLLNLDILNSQSPGSSS